MSELHPDLPLLWDTETDMKNWLLVRLRESGMFSHVVPELQMVDVFGNRAAADIGLVGLLHGQQFLIALELKLDSNISANAADGFSQAYHYREMCVVNDQRLPAAVQRKSPNLAFAGVFIHAHTTNYHNERLKGMEILTTKLRVGGIHFSQGDYGSDLSFRMGEAVIFRIKTNAKYWHTNADQYLFGSVKRNGSRKHNGTLGERVLNLYPNADLFGDATL